MEKETQKYIFYILVGLGGLFTLNNKISSENTEPASFVNQESLPTTDEQNLLEMDFVGLNPINWTRQHISAKTLATYSNETAPSGITSYLIVRYPFMSEDELIAAKKLIKSLNLQSDSDYYAQCLFNDGCEYASLLAEHPKSKWRDIWKERSAIAGLQRASKQLNMLNSDSVPTAHLEALTMDTQFGEVVHPKATEIVVVTPYYENCQRNSDRLINYLQAIKLKHSMLSDIADSYLADAIRECV